MTSSRQLQQWLRVGLARAGNASTTLAPPLDALLPAQDATPESHLWLALASVDLWERGGFVPEPAGAEAPAACPPERLRACPARAEALLALLLRGVYPADLLASWLRELARHGARVPPRFLPKLLDLATRQPDLRALLHPVLGERGHWLARSDDAWHWAAAADADAPDPAWWDTGSLDQRVAAVRAWRLRDPGGARDALAAVWKTETPEARAALIAALESQLGPDDEPFLEAALDDKRKEVRAAARTLLARLPDSRFLRRMLERLQPVLLLERPAAGPARLDVVLPAECDAAMRRDGIGTGQHPGLGEKAGWVVDMLATLDPQAWSRQFGLAPGACIAAAEQGESAEVLVRGWSLAATHHGLRGDSGTAAWVRDLVAWWVGAQQGLRNVVTDGLFAVHAALFHDDRDGTLGALLDALPAGWMQDASILQLLQWLAAGAPDSWPGAPSRRMLQRLDGPLRVNGLQLHSWYVTALLGKLARTVAPGEALAYEAAWRAQPPDSPWQNALGQFFDTVRFRHETTLSFQEPA